MSSIFRYCKYNTHKKCKNENESALRVANAVKPQALFWEFPLEQICYRLVFCIITLHTLQYVPNQVSLPLVFTNIIVAFQND